MAETKKAEVKSKVTSPTDFAWAYNKIKLKQAYTALVEAKKLDPGILIDEESLKEAYILRAGLLADQQAINIKAKRPRSTSNIKD